ncbi:MAG TPA: hypothetical protein VFT59_02810 [Candidatus Saccharimonadales bacterium]|nr:hypothetical protein [Candidatus Saccharimonadales bacterium]
MSSHFVTPQEVASQALGALHDPLQQPLNNGTITIGGLALQDSDLACYAIQQHVAQELRGHEAAVRHVLVVPTQGRVTIIFD